MKKIYNIYPNNSWKIIWVEKLSIYVICLKLSLCKYVPKLNTNNDVMGKEIRMFVFYGLKIFNAKQSQLNHWETKKIKSPSDDFYIFLDRLFNLTILSFKHNEKSISEFHSKRFIIFRIIWDFRCSSKFYSLRIQGVFEFLVTVFKTNLNLP